MGRKKRAFKKEHVGFVRNYIEKKLIARNWPSGETRQAALNDFRQRPTVGRYAHDELTRWCYQWLNDTQWQCLKNTMNSWLYRQKVPERPKRVQLSPDAWQIISTLAEMEKKTISSFIVDRLEAEYRVVADNHRIQGVDSVQGLKTELKNYGLVGKMKGEHEGGDGMLSPVGGTIIGDSSSPETQEPTTTLPNELPESSEEK